MLLVADRDSGLVRSLQILLEDDGAYHVEVVESAEAAVARLDAPPRCDLVLSDLPTLGTEARRLIGAVSGRRPGPPLFLLTAHPALARGVHALDGPDLTLVGLPIEPEELLVQLATAVRATLGVR